jgi:hypothetical protein
MVHSFEEVMDGPSLGHYQGCRAVSSSDFERMGRLLSSLSRRTTPLFFFLFSLAGRQSVTLPVCLILSFPQRLFPFLLRTQLELSMPRPRQTFLQSSLINNRPSKFQTEDKHASLSCLVSLALRNMRSL